MSDVVFSWLRYGYEIVRVGNARVDSCVLVISVSRAPAKIVKTYSMRCLFTKAARKVFRTIGTMAGRTP